jgi:hypothetical protein
LKEKINKYLHELHWGQWLLSKFMFIPTIGTFLIVLKVPKWVYYVFLVFSIYFVILVGRFIIKKGIKDEFIRRDYDKFLRH